MARPGDDYTSSSGYDTGGQSGYDYHDPAPQQGGRSTVEETFASMINAGRTPAGGPPGSADFSSGYPPASYGGKAGFSGTAGPTPSYFGGGGGPMSPSDGEQDPLLPAAGPGPGGGKSFGQPNIFENIFVWTMVFCCFTLFSYPFVQSCYLGSQTNIQFWLGRQGEIALFVPVIFAGFYVIQERLGTPRRVLVIVSTLVPSVIFILIGNSYYAGSQSVANRLLSTDCTTFIEKRELDRAWFMAHAFYMDCLRKLAHGPLLRIEDAMKVYRIHHCEEYDQAYEQYETEWSYLSYVEENHLCSGWCQVGPRLWSFRDAKDSCSVAVGNVFESEVQRTGLQIMVFSIISLILSIVGIFVGPAVMKKMSN